MSELDKHQRRILRFIERYENQNGRTPSYEEIRQGTGMSSKDHVYRDVQALEEQHYVRREPSISRGISLLRTADGYPVTTFSYSIPVLPSISEQETHPKSDLDIQDWIEITRAMIPDAEDVFAFRVEGNSMIDALVHDGDLVVLKRQKSVRNGELAAVRLGSSRPKSATSLKRIYRYDGEVWLQPENPQIEASKLPASEVEIIGAVLCIIRNLPASDSVRIPRRRAA